MKKRNFIVVRMRSGNQSHIGIGDMALCNSKRGAWKVSEDLSKVTCKKCRKNWKGIFKEVE